jgi:hypothetical protein
MIIKLNLNDFEDLGNLEYLAKILSNELSFSPEADKIYNFINAQKAAALDKEE